MAQCRFGLGVALALRAVRGIGIIGVGWALTKVDPDNLKRNVALMSSLAWFLANIDGEIGRAPEQE